MRTPSESGNLIINASKTDVNVITWNQRSPNLLASGDDEG